MGRKHNVKFTPNSCQLKAESHFTLNLNNGNEFDNFFNV